MENRNANQQQPGMPPRNNKTSTTVGAIIILFGSFLLLKNLSLNAFLPNWIFGWQMILIIIGLVIGVNSKFEKKSALILITIGSVFLLRDWIGFSAGKVLFPALAIGLGFYLIKRNRKTPIIPTTPTDGPPKHPTDEFDWDKRVMDDDSGTAERQHAYQQDTSSHTHSYTNGYGNSHFQSLENYLKIDAIFGNAKKIIMSRNFLGGTLTNVFGSTEINLLQADLKQPVVIDIFQLFGSTKIIVPPHWGVTMQVSSILSDNDDRRVLLNHPYDEHKKLYLTGSSIFGSVTLKNS